MNKTTGSKTTGTDPQRPGSASGDPRLYVSTPEGLQAHLKHGWEKEYCYLQNPGEDYFHLLVNGEIYLQRGNEKFCLNCALRRGIVSRDRLNWQYGVKDGLTG